MWRTLRIVFLLMVLACVAFTAYVDRERSVSWRSPLWVGIFPVAGDTSERTTGYIAGLSAQDFQPIAEFMGREAARRGRPPEVLRLRLHPGPVVPPPERGESHGAVANVLWSLRLRWYAWRRMAQVDGPPPTVRLFVIYHDPTRTVKVPHSVGLQKGLVGVVHVFASHDQQGSNQVVIAHELLHTLGATDKYGADDMPRWPEGYADPGQEPRLPQRRAELMAGTRARRALIHGIAFWSGFFVMAVELLGGRLLAPNFGSSIYVWGAIISVFMLALSLGYLAGGRWSLNSPSLTRLSLILIAAAITALPVLPLSEAPLETLAIHIADPRWGSLAAAVLLFFVPTFLSGMVSPYCVRLIVDGTETSGRRAGQLFFVSTFGSAGGTILTSFYLVKYFEVNRILLGLATISIVLGLAGLAGGRSR